MVVEGGEGGRDSMVVGSGVDVEVVKASLMEADEIINSTMKKVVGYAIVALGIWAYLRSRKGD